MSRSTSRRRGERDAAVDVDGVVAVIVGAVEDKADLGIDRPAEKHAHVAVDAARIGAERVEQAGDRTLAERPIDDDAERAVVIVLRHQDDGVLERRAAQCRRRDQKLAGKRGAA